MPYAANLAVIFSINLAYLETVKQTLIEDGVRCQTARSN
jgi:hypothetical protein